MDSASFQILSNLKIFTTAILYNCCFKKINKTKWFALSLLFVGSALYCFGNYKSKKDILEIKNIKNMTDLLISGKLDNSLLNNSFYVTKIGIILTVVFSFISGLSGVYNEYLFKQDFSDSIYIQNIYIYFYGCILNFIGGIFENLKGKNSFYTLTFQRTMPEFFKGFTRFTWIIVFIQVLGGISMSLVMKYASNITRLFIISSSLIVTIGLSVLLFSLKLNVYFYFCLMTILISLCLYITS